MAHDCLLCRIQKYFPWKVQKWTCYLIAHFEQCLCKRGLRKVRSMATAKAENVLEAPAPFCLPHHLHLFYPSHLSLRSRLCLPWQVRGWHFLSAEEESLSARCSSLSPRCQGCRHLRQATPFLSLPTSSSSPTPCISLNFILFPPWSTSLGFALQE